MRKMGFKNSYYSSFEKGNTRVVAVLKSNRVSFLFSSQITDKEGCYLLIKGFIDNREITRVNVYRPPGSDKALIKKVFNMITVRLVDMCWRLEHKFKFLPGLHR